MRKLIFLVLIILTITKPVYALEFTAPAAPDSAAEFMPPESKSFGEDLWSIVKSAISTMLPSVRDAVGVCVAVIALVLLISMVQSFSGVSKNVVELAGAVAIGCILFHPSGALIQLGTQTVTEMTEYNKVLLPVLTAALAAQGGTSSSVSLYTGTMVLNTLLGWCVSGFVVPLIYIYLILSVAGSAVGEQTLDNIRNFVKWLISWSIKLVLYVFTGYMGVTGVVSGTTDAAAVKATKLAINGMVPVVGSIASDASESILVSAGVLKNAAGIYGFIAIFALWISPFLKIGVQYILLKATAGICGIYGQKQTVKLIKDYSTAMGFLLAMTGTVCLLLLISTVCFMKGMSYG